MNYQLTRAGKLIEKHSTKEACFVAAVERGWVMRSSPDFIGDPSGKFLLEGIEIIKDE